MAGLIYMIGSVWDGIADLLTGIWAERGRPAYARVISYGAIPLGLAFPLLYFAPPSHGMALVVGLLVAQIAFRSLYALVNISYAAWSVRISSDSRDRAAIAGVRMLFGTIAAVVVSLSTERISLAVSGTPTGTTGFLVAAALFAAIATPLLIHVARGSPHGADASPIAPRTPVLRGLATLGANRAFVTLCAAMMCIAIASTMLSRSVLYYFTKVVRDALAGTTALAVAGSTVFALTDTGAAWRADLFLVTMQAALAAFSFVFWAILPDTVEYGELHSGVRVEALSFGVAALLQKVSIGAATAITGFAYSAIGYAPQTAQSPEIITDIRWIMVAAPILGCLLSALAMAANPLRRDTHRRIVATLAERAAARPPA